jgi:hypothetical protein
LGCTRACATEAGSVIYFDTFISRVRDGRLVGDLIRHVFVAREFRGSAVIRFHSRVREETGSVI